MSLDHFRPKSFPVFQHLVNDPTNLVWACRVCNNRKNDKWPAIGTPHTHINSEGFIDPFQENRTAYFGVNDDGRLVAQRPPAKYMIKVLLLNRPLARKTRAKRIASHMLGQLMQIERAKLAKIESMIARGQEPSAATQQLLEAQSILDELTNLIETLEFDSTLYCRR